MMHMNENQGKRDDQIEFSLKMVFGALIGIIAILLFCIVAVVVESLI